MVFGIALEGVVFGLGLWTLCLNAPAILDHAGLPPMAVGGPNPKLVTYVGVGVYEEVIFRLIAFAWLARVLRIATGAGHRRRPDGRPGVGGRVRPGPPLRPDRPVRPRRVPHPDAGRGYCAVLFWLRGLGVAVGAHIVYDIVVGTRRASADDSSDSVSSLIVRQSK